MDPPLLEQLVAQELFSLEQLALDIRSLRPASGDRAPAVRPAGTHQEEAGWEGLSPEAKRRRLVLQEGEQPPCTLTSQQLRERNERTLSERRRLADSICGLLSHDSEGRLALQADPGACVRDVVRCRSGGQEIPVELRRRLLSELSTLAWPKKRHRAKSVTAERYLVIWRDPGPRPGHEGLFGLLQELMACCDDSWTHVAVTKNFEGSPHRDEQDATWQRVISLGEFSGGELCVEGPADGDSGALRRLYVVSTRNRLTRIDGRFLHFVRRREGDRYSLVFYCLDAERYTEPVRPLELSDIVFIEPAT